jgi:hypothetical protein
MLRLIIIGQALIICCQAIIIWRLQRALDTTNKTLTLAAQASSLLADNQVDQADLVNQIIGRIEALENRDKPWKSRPNSP